MTNNPPPERRRHPLEQPPAPPPGGAQPRQRVTLHIPSVRPTVTYTLIAINVLVFIIRALSPQLDDQIFTWGANHPPDILLGAQYYRLLTSMFLHAGIYADAFGTLDLVGATHIIFNMYVLYAVGQSMERLFGHARFLVIYLLGGLTGAVLSTLLNSANTYSVGASGAVFAIIGAEFIYLYHHRKLMGEAGRQRRQSLIIFGIMNLAVGFLSALPGSNMLIDNWAHIGGLAGGLILSWFISPILDLKAHPDHPGEILGVDTNPFPKNYWIVSAYSTALIVVMFVGVFLSRR
jgi:rhomboid protease GluP